MPIASTDWPDFSGAKEIGVDCETNDPKLKELGPGTFRDGQLVGVSLAGEIDGETVSRYFPIGHESGNNLDREKVIRYLSDQLSNPKQAKVGANLAYDVEYLLTAGADVRGAKMYDVLVAEPVLDENKRPDEYDLDSVAERYLGKTKDDEALYQWLADHFGGKPDRRSQASRIWRAPPEIVAPYAESDAILPLEALDVQREYIAQDDLGEIFDLETDLFWMLNGMRMRGVRIHRDGCENAQRELSSGAEEARRVLEMNGVEAFTAATIGAYCDAAGIPYSRTPKSGLPSVTDAWLKKQTDEVLQAVREVRESDKNRGTFVEGLLKHMVNDRVHCQFNQLRSDKYGTVSGRFSSSNPNLQNIPARKEEMMKLIRGLFIPDEGEIWGGADYSQIEYRLLVHYAVAMYNGGKGSQAMLDRFLNDPTTDMHQAVADLCGITRKDGKNINFGMVYGLGVDALIARLGYPREECEKIIAAYQGMMPFGKSLYYDAQRVASTRGNIRTIGGRLRRYNKYEPKVPFKKGQEPPPWLAPYMTKRSDGLWYRDNSKRPKALPWDEAVVDFGCPEAALQRSHTHTALNALLQGGAADIMKRAMADIWKSGVCDVLGAPLLTVHDELNWSVPDTKEGREAFEESLRIMENTYKDRLKIPMVVDSALGKTWAECK